MSEFTTSSLKYMLFQFPLRLPRYRGIHRRFQKYTMISRGVYLRNLALVDAYAHVSGTVVECGVWRGGMTAGMASVLGPDREYHLFDSFEGLPPPTANDGPAAVAWQADKSSASYYDNCAAEESEATAVMNLAGSKRFTLHRGWFDKTIAPWARNSPPIAILRLDCDWYDSMKICLENLVPRVVPGGIIIVDDYDGWEGCTRAVHDYLAAMKKPLGIRQFLNGPFYLLNETTH